MAYRNRMLNEKEIQWAVEPDRDGRGVLELSGWGAKPDIRSGGRIVLFTGWRERLRFTAVADIREAKAVRSKEPVTRQPVEDTAEPWQLSLVLANYQKLPEATKLLDFAYSLSLISNLTAPWKHVRNKWTMPDVDVETLLLQRIHTARTYYFGILAGLPDDWSTMLDGLAKSRRMGRMAVIDDWKISAQKDDGTALPELVELLETHVVSVAQSAAEIAKLHPKVLEGEEYPEVVALGENNALRWDLRPLLMTARRVLSEVQATGPRLREAEALRDEQQFPRIEWRPYRW